MATNPRYANGHRRRQLRARLLAQGGTCAWPDCPWPGEEFDRALHHLDPRAPVVDEIVPISRGGSPVSRENTRLLHRWCNQKRGAARPARGTGDAQTTKRSVATGDLPTATRW